MHSALKALVLSSLHSKLLIKLLHKSKQCHNIFNKYQKMFIVICTKIEDIHYFTNVKKLIYANQTTPDFSILQKIEDIELLNIRSDIFNHDIKHIEKCKKLTIYDTTLQAMCFHHMTSLEYMYLGSCEIQSRTVSWNCQIV